MAVIKRKTLKALIKPARQLLKKHGPEVAMAVVTSLITYLATDGDDKKMKNIGKKLKKAQKNGNFVAEATSGLVTNAVSHILPKKAKKKARKLKDAAADAT